jgi:predicted ATPase/class 3 adenylate cyclase
MDIADWLRSLGLEQYEPAFRDHAIDGAVLPRLTRDDLKDIGVGQVGHRRILLDAIAFLGEAAPAPTSSAIGSTSPPPTASPVVAAVPSGGERRQLTVMFCDLADSTALSEKLDPEELRSLLHAYRNLCGDVIARYDGFVARYVGDGILTYFGWPSAHEDDAERAVRAALEIVQTVRRASSTEALSVHIGIATGPVVVGEQAGAGDQSKLAVGSTPNLAARLQGLAAAEQIVIAAATRRLVGNAFELTDLGEHGLKGIAEPVHGWRVERALATESRFDANRGAGDLTPMVGRDGELDLLLRRWSQAKDGEGQVVVLSGEPGIGKSRILGALRERLEAQGVQVRRFQCSPYHVNSAFWPIIDHFERTLKFTRDETTDAKLDKLEALIVTQYGRPLADVRFVASILSIPSEQRNGALPMTPQKHKVETLRTLVDLIEAAARQQASVMLFEDAQWADPTTLEMLDLLIDRAKTVPLLVVLTHRPEFQSRWSGQRHVSALNLSKLTRAQSATMVSTLAGGKTLPATLLEQILTRTDGVPLFVEELTKSILESGELTEAGDHYEYGGSARAVTIPATLRDSLMARLDRLGSAKETAQFAAVIGREFSHTMLAAIVFRKEQLAETLLRLIEAELVFRRGIAPNASYVFKHALVRDAAYDSLLTSTRRQLHARIAQELEDHFDDVVAGEPDVLAHHWGAAGLTKKAAAYRLKAGERALARSATKEAMAQLMMGQVLLDSLPDDDECRHMQLNLQIALGTAISATHGMAAVQAARAYQRARELCGQLGDEHRLIPVLMGLWNSHNARDELIDAREVAAQLLQFAKQRGDPVARILGHRALGPTLFQLGEFESAVEHFQQLVTADVSEGRHFSALLPFDPCISGRSWLSLTLAVLGYPEQAIKHAEKALADAEHLQHRNTLAVVLSLRCSLGQFLRDHHDVAHHVKALLALAVERDFAYWAGLATYFLGWTHSKAGDIAVGSAEMRQGLAACQSTGAQAYVPYNLALLADARRRAHDPLQGRTLLNEALDLLAQTGARYCEAELLCIDGELRLAMPQPDRPGAEDSFRRAIEIAHRQRAKMVELRATVCLSQLWTDGGRRREAYDLLAPIYGWFTEGFNTHHLVEAKTLIDALTVN